MVTAEGQAGEAACLWVRFDPSVSPLTICLTLLYDFSAVRCTHTKAAEAPRRIIGNILLESVPAMVGALLHTHLCCDRFKSNKLTEKVKFDQEPDVISNRVLPCLIDLKTV